MSKPASTGKKRVVSWSLAPGKTVAKNKQGGSECPALQRCSCSHHGLIRRIFPADKWSIPHSWAGPQDYRTATSWDEKGQLLRVHAGLEDIDDLITDLGAGLDRLTAIASI